MPEERFDDLVPRPVRVPSPGLAAVLSDLKAQGIKVG